ncbi:MAG: type II toxin-antitoxin system HicA family toxin [Chloroflexota bacterium]
MPDRVPRLRSDEVPRVLRAHGFVLASQRGSHQKWRHPDSGHQGFLSDDCGRRPAGDLLSHHRHLPLRLHSLLDGPIVSSAVGSEYL